MALVLQHKVVSSLPSTLQANSIYYVRVGLGFDIYVTNSSGTIVAYPLNGQDIAIWRRQTITLPLVNIGSVDVPFTWNTAFPILAGLNEAQTLAKLSVIPMSTPMGVSVNLLGKVVVTLKTKTLTGGVLTITNSGLLSLSVGTTLDIIGVLEP